MKKEILTGGNGQQVPPCLEHVNIYFEQKGLSKAVAQSFYQHYKQKNWVNRYNKQITNWKRIAWEWIWMRPN